MYALAKDASPAASPKVVTPGVDTGIPQYPTAYNGDTAEHIEVTPAATESSPTPYMESSLVKRHSDVDTSTTTEPVRSLLISLCI